MYNITLNLAANTLTSILSPSSGKSLYITYITLNVDSNMFDPLELYIGTTKIFNILCVRSGVMYGFNLGNFGILGSLEDPLKVISPISAAINLNIIYEES